MRGGDARRKKNNTGQNVARRGGPAAAAAAAACVYAFRVQRAAARSARAKFLFSLGFGNPSGALSRSRRFPSLAPACLSRETRRTVRGGSRLAPAESERHRFPLTSGACHLVAF